MTVKKLTVAAVIAELALFVVLAVWLQTTGWPGSAPDGSPPAFAGSFGNFTPIDPRPPAPDIPFRDGDDGEVALADFRGKVVLVNFWATWCAPCLREMPDLDRLQKSMGGKDFEVVAISVDREGREVTGPWLKSKGLANLAIWTDRKSKLMQSFGPRGLPTSYIIDRAGRVAGTIEGAAEWDSRKARALIRHYMGESP